ncbi:hypothetical protein HYN48_13285 [Flavobacterium magnum]|uniref:Uncharacterized protein n=1 Tax=Flavobacterium magnum TaxID=2162713 RepID=A0A2S0RGU4_9FLAO|nr:hypothetical protein [Flavobacterium magnum]AWA30973.1 hypothetical protein HYN48_13285 [Flavobacterium magnum]
MKGFIKVIDVNDKEHFLNIDYIIKFTPTGQAHRGNAIVTTVSETIQTTTTVDEIVDMIKLQ